MCVIVTRCEEDAHLPISPKSPAFMGRASPFPRDLCIIRVYATRMVCLRVPLLFLYGLLLYLPPIRNRVGGAKPGCNGDECEV